ncbi:MAG TPA: zinc ribbon domain-containing protein [Dehalococcoidia bacterium]|jgi:RNA polymerase subunit RPABC4/transcription elongation factor Spt4|nr:zinc ribbon domain-containing protein [Dehalococcoidia bacterium]
MTNLLVSWPGGSLESALRLGGLILLAYALVLWLGAVVWVYRDIRNRTTDQGSQLIAVILVAVFNVPGLVIYLVIRPQTTLADAYERSLEAEAILHELQLTANACQSCRRPIEDDFNVCPHCRVVLREPCRSCGRPVRTSWAACPYCAADRVPSRMQQAAPSTPSDGLPPRRNVPATQQPLQRRPQTQPQAAREDGLPRRPSTTPQQIDS